jgi:polyhydroxybutyrate depolymerase
MPGLTRETFDIGGETRSFLFAEPAARPTAVVLSLHGSRSRADRQARLSRMATLADQPDGAAVAFPQAVSPVGSGYQWDHRGDLAFLVALTESLVERYRPPQGRAIITGMSGGARMACYLAASRSDLVATVGAVAGLRAIGDHGPTRPVPIVAFHGTADRINPYAGGTTPRWDESVRDAATRWAVANGRPSQPTDVAISATSHSLDLGRGGRPR